MAVKSALTIAEVDALFNASLQPKPAPRAPKTPAKPWTPRYDRCSSCRTIAACLSSYSGDTDGSPEVPLDSPLRAAITALRASTGKRTINLCSHCECSMLQYQSPDPVIVQSVRLFEL